jgi:hypothetical protein
MILLAARKLWALFSSSWIEEHRGGNQALAAALARTR